MSIDSSSVKKSPHPSPLPDYRERENVARWPLWRIVLAYGTMAILALLAVWFVDRKVHLLALPPANPQTTSPIPPINP